MSAIELRSSSSKLSVFNFIVLLPPDKIDLNKLDFETPPLEAFSLSSFNSFSSSFISPKHMSVEGFFEGLSFFLFSFIKSSIPLPKLIFPDFFELSFPIEITDSFELPMSMISGSNIIMIK